MQNKQRKIKKNLTTDQRTSSATDVITRAGENEPAEDAVQADAKQEVLLFIRLKNK